MQLGKLTSFIIILKDIHKMDKGKDAKSKLKSLIEYLAKTGGREKVHYALFSYAGWCSISADTW